MIFACREIFSKIYRAVFEIQIVTFNTKFRKVAKFRTPSCCLNFAKLIRYSVGLIEHCSKFLDFFQAVFTESEPRKVVNRDSLSPTLKPG